ncbi:Protein of uncharacterised function (DUF664) [Mycobacteroides abscessus]|nr:Protein of uncharacterised function (DUF664) [Mycobacteroides abscessus]
MSDLWCWVVHASSQPMRGPHMPAMPPPVLTELDGLIEYIAQQQDAFRIVAFGLTDEQARLTPTAGTLSIGGLIKHVTNMQAGWTDRIVSAPGPGTDHQRAEDEFILRADETLAGALAAFTAQSAATLAAIKEKGLETPVPSRPRRGFPKTSTPGMCDGWRCISSRNWLGTRVMPTSFARPLTARRRTSYSRRLRAGSPPTGSSPGRPRLSGRSAGFSWWSQNSAQLR